LEFLALPGMTFAPVHFGALSPYQFYYGYCSRQSGELVPYENCQSPNSPILFPLKSSLPGSAEEGAISSTVNSEFNFPKFQAVYPLPKYQHLKEDLHEPIAWDKGIQLDFVTYAVLQN
jgi:hypothetical protein